MSPELYLAFVVATVIALVVPGPTILLVVSYALARGRNVTLALVSGVILGDLIAMSVTLAGLGIVLAASASVFTMMKWAGALYLAWMGIGMIRKAGTATAELQAVGQRGSGTAFRDGFIVTLLNPKSIGFFIAFVPQFIDSANPVVPQFLIMIVTFVGLGGINVLAYALLAARLRDKVTRPGALAWLQRAGGGVLICLAAFTLTLRRAV
ncbi:MAG: lysine transporter LysE [SAR116 cluster bacterium MED-G05]|jgi:threonine/homoserine/homoserine lactone efflux protein|nr:MAG: lysine transporter LysE [SAR116 cluster bacterium MED-G05]HAO57340.1 lysine transporter LysE [Alphaproteobacteria bacterium]HBD53142.1 lysine transporter LysE [Alphaproteobacteria bacterium]HBP60452.1 lysine transporter LysE [Alphaproteobacteria bacterium]HCA92345.1 lysine transporter LysE [Alphaproteobacteria bacterium]|tara:strand:- start:590 stop:1216 length:627 start_codon:yes stop_codon:yes gene_type:complete